MIRRGFDMYFTKANLPDILYILDHLRAGDAHELRAATSVDEPAELLDYYMSVIPHQAVFHVVSECRNSPPIAMIGVTTTSPGLGEAHMVATDDFPKVGLELTRWVRDFMMPHLGENFRRVECRAMKKNTRACQWLRYLKAREECELPDFGANGEVFIQFAWSGKDVRRKQTNS